MRGFLTYLVVLIVIFAIFQFIPSYEKSNPKFDISKEIKVSKELKEIFRRSCYDCHSYETKWPWYADIAPMKWVVRRDVVEGRKALNFSICFMPTDLTSRSPKCILLSIISVKALTAFIEGGLMYISLFLASLIH